MADDRNPVEELAEEFIARYRRGEKPSLTEYLDKYPQHGDEIRDVFPALLMVEDFKPRSEDPVAAPLQGAVTSSGVSLEQIGDYRILREIGRGGMGVVYEAEQESLGRRVALKVLPAHSLLDPKYLERFEREARAAGRLHHSNIVPVFGVGDQDGLHYYVMQFIDGLGLDDVLVELRRFRQERSDDANPSASGESDIDNLASPSASSVARAMLSGSYQKPASQASEASGKPSSPGFAASGPRDSDSVVTSLTSSELMLPGDTSSPPSSHSGRHYWHSVARIGVQVADALEYAHSHGTLHRDIKPSNLLLDTSGTVWITDFGLAKLDEEAGLTHTGDIVGTLRYMAPERLRGESDGRGDIYGLGLTLYELATFKPAFRDSDRQQLIERVTQREAPRPRKINPQVPRDLETIVLKAIDRDVATRYQTPGDLKRDLERFLEDKPIKARRASAPERLWRWARRNPAVAALSAALLLLTLMLLAGSTTAAVLLARSNRISLKRAADATAAEREAIESKQLGDAALYEAYVAESRALRASGQVGQSVGSLKALANAVQQIPQLGLDERERLQVRNDAIKSMALVDASLQESWPLATFKAESCSIDADGERYAGRQGPSTISVRSMADNSEIARLESLEALTASKLVRFSPDRRFLAVRFRKDNGYALHVWQIGANLPIQTADLPQFCANSFDFSRDSSRLAIIRPDGSIQILSGPEFEVSRTLPSQSPAQAVRFDPSGSRLAVVRSQRTEILDIDTGVVLQSFSSIFSGLDYGALDWRPDGKQLAVACSDRVVRVWEVVSGEAVCWLQGHGGEVIHIGFHPAGRRIVTSSYDGTTKVWDMSGRELLELDAVCTHFSRDGRWLCGRAQRWRFLDGRQYLRRFNSLWNGYHAGGRLAVAHHADGWRLVDTRSETPHDSTLVAGSARFNESGKFLVVIQPGEQGRREIIYRLPVETAADDSHSTIRIGPPKRIAHFTASGYWRWSLGTSMLALVDYGSIILGNIETGEARRAASQHPDVRWMDWSSDDRLLATGTWHGHNVKIWDTATGKLLAEHELKDARVRFSPDDRTLVMGSYGQFLFQSVGGDATQQPRSVKKRSGGPPGAIGYSPDGSLVALAEKFKSIRLLDSATLAELVTVTTDAGDEINHVEFSPDGGRLLVTARRRSYEWNLRNVRARLSQMGLDWEGPAIAEAGPDAEKELRLEVDLGDLKTLAREEAESVAALVELEEYERSLQDFRQRAESTPDDAQLQAELAWLLVAGPDEPDGGEEVLSLMEPEVSLAPRDWKKLTALGIAQFRLGRFETAVEALERAHRSPHRECPALHLFFLAAACHETGDSDRAELCYNAALQWRDLMWNQLPLWQSDQLERLRAETLKLLGAAIMIDEFPALSAAARESELAGLEKATEFVNEYPNHQYGWWTRGRSLGALQKHSAAILDCTVAIELTPDIHHSYYWRGASWMAKYHHEQAIADFTKSLSITPEDAWPMRHLALMYAIDPEPRDVERALPLAKQALAMKPNHPSVLSVLGVVLYRQGQWEESLEHLEKSDSIKPLEPVFLYFMAMCHHRLGQPDEAQQCLLRAENGEAGWHPKQLRSLIRAEAHQVLADR